MFKKIKVVICSFFFMLFLFIGGEAFSAEPVPMPKGLEGVYLGMSLEELKAAKPNLENSGFYQEYLFFEYEIQDGFFTKIAYKFNNEFKLTRVTMSETKTAGVVGSKILGLVKGATLKWGDGYVAKVGTIDKHYATNNSYTFPLFYWNLDGAQVYLYYLTTVDRKFSPNGYGISIFDDSMPLNDAINHRDPVDQAEIDELFKDVPLAKAYTGQVFE